MFEAPLFLLAAAAGAVVPLILHLMQKRRSQPIEFPTLRFLQMAQHASARHIRMQHFLLWLLRTMIMIFLGAAFALPVIRSAGAGFLGRASRDVGIVLDMSYTMHYAVGDQSVFARAQAAAISIIEGLQEGDRYFIVLAGQTPRTLFSEPIRDRQYGIAQLRELSPDYTTSYLLPAVEHAHRTLQEHAGRRQTELHVLTDNRAAAWMERERRSGTEEGDQLDVPTFVLSVGAASPENYLPKTIDIDPSMILPDGGNRFVVTFAGSGLERERIVQLYINDLEYARKPVLISPEASNEATFTLPALERGVHVGRVEISADNLVIDDTFYFLLHVGSVTPSLVVGRERDTLFLRAAIRASAGTADAFEHVERDSLPLPSMDEYAVVFLCNALPLPGEAIDQLTRYVREGGVLVFFAGVRASLSDYEMWNILPAVPTGERDFEGRDARKSLSWENVSHPIMEDMDDFVGTPQIALERMVQVGDWDPSAEVLIRTVDGLPLLLHRFEGEGSVLFFTIGADRAWSNFPLTPLYMPVIAQLLDYGRGTRLPAPYVVSGSERSLGEMLPGLSPDAELFDSEREAVEIRRVVQDGRSVAYFDEPLSPGIYYHSDVDQTEPALAVNLDRRDSDLTPFPEEQIPAVLDQDDVQMSTAVEDLERLLHAHRVGYSLAELFLWIALLLIGLEFVYANHLAIKSTSNTGATIVDLAGKIHGTVGASKGGK